MTAKKPLHANPTVRVDMERPSDISESSANNDLKMGPGWAPAQNQRAEDLELPDDPKAPDLSVRKMLSDVSLGARRSLAAAGTAFYEADMPARALFFIHDGHVRMYHVGQNAVTHLVEILGPGDWFGVPALTHGEDSRYGTRAVAMTAVTVSRVPVAHFLAALPNHPAVARELLSQLSSKIQCLWARGKPCALRK